MRKVQWALVVAWLAAGCAEPHEEPAEAEIATEAGHEGHVAPPAHDAHAGHAAPAGATDPIAAQQQRAALASTEKVPEGLNAVQNEMLLLEAATRDMVTAVANDQLAAIPPLLHGVHGAKDLTAKAIAAGEWKPPKNADDVAGFVAMDEAFHGELVKLLKAAQADDLPAATKQLGVVLDGCTSCHEQYRF